MINTMMKVLLRCTYDVIDAGKAVVTMKQTVQEVNPQPNCSNYIQKRQRIFISIHCSGWPLTTGMGIGTIICITQYTAQFWNRQW